MPLVVLATDVDVLAQIDDVVWIGKLLEYDAERAVFRPHSKELADDQYKRHIQTDDSTTAHISLTQYTPRSLKMARFDRPCTTSY